MNNPVLFETRSKTLYMYSAQKNQILLCHPILYFLIKLQKREIELNAWLDGQESDSIQIEDYGTYSIAEIQYYYKKLLMLKENGYFLANDFKKKLYGRLTPYAVKSNLANTMQVTLEVTESCNLKCEYCGYGKFYSNYDKRENKSLNFLQVKNIFNYLTQLWNSTLNKSHSRIINVGFYGGEPLLNFSLIKDTVEYLSKMQTLHNKFSFGMTTNGLLLEKYMDYFVEKDFRLLISLDGNKENNAYRIYQNGQSAYDTIYRNVINLKNKYPKYFEKNVNFNSVLHRKNSVSEIHNYFKNTFGKTSNITEVSTNGINPEMHNEFRKTYQNFKESLNQAEDYSSLEKEMFTNFPDTKSTMEAIFQYSGYVFTKYQDLIFSKEHESFIPTGTCLPFSRKVFVTVNGKILPCERIGHQFALGNINEAGVEIDFQEISNKYNSYYDKLKKQCSTCYNSRNCKQCIFYLNIEDENPVCYGYMEYRDFSKYLGARISYLEENPELFHRFFNEVTVI